MPTDTDLSRILAVFDKIIIYLGRHTVQIQLLIIVAVVLVAWSISHMSSRWLRIRARIWANGFPRRRQRVLSRLLTNIAFAVTFPLLVILLLESAGQIMARQGMTAGLLDKTQWIFWTLLAFQIFMAVLYTFFDEQIIRRNHYRLFLPLLIMLILLEALSNLTDLRALGSTVLATIFNSPLTLGAVFIATVGLYFWTGAARITEDLLYQIFSAQSNVDKGSAKAGLTLMRYLLIGLGVAFVLSQLQLEPSTVAAITGGLSVGIGFALREILSNFVSGILLLFEQSLHPGDVIEVDGEISVVEDVRMRSTIVRTLNNDEVVIPNQMFFTDSFKTYTGTDKTVRVPIYLRTDCVIEPSAVVQHLVDTALSHPDVLQKPAPSVFLLEYGDNVASFQLNVWIDNPVLRPKVTSEIKLLVWDVFAEHNIALPFPEVELHFPKKVNLEMLQSKRAFAPTPAAD